MRKARAINLNVRLSAIALLVCVLAACGGGGGSFRVESRAAGGTWQTVESLAASPGTGGTYRWYRVLDVSKDYRVSAVKTGYTVQGSSNQLLLVAIPTSSLQLHQIELPWHW